MTTPPPGILTKFNLSNAVFAIESGIAKVWKVQYEGKDAALKIYNGFDSKNEWPGFDLINELNGAGVVQLHRYEDGVALMEWLDGPSLGDLSRAGQDEAAAQELAKVANQIHAASRSVTLDLPTVTKTFHDLLSLDPPDGIAPDLKENLHRCMKLARELIEKQDDLIGIHGDLHHDNIKLGQRGYTAFDAKGERGPRAYEFANTFRNPEGADHLTSDPVRAKRMAAIWGQATGIASRQLLEWGAVRAALSLAWTGDFGDTPDRRTIAMMLQILDNG